jgi:flagellar basal body rod protein FlgB
MDILSLFGPGTNSAMLRGGLDETSATQRTIAARVAGATSSSSTDGDFATQLGAHQKGPVAPPSQVDLQQDMAALADTELRYETCAKLLSSEYAGIKSAIQTTNG